MTPTAVATTETGHADSTRSALRRPGFDPDRDLPAGFMDFFLPLHRRFTPRQQELALQAGRSAAAIAGRRQADTPLPFRHGAQRLADHAARLVPGPAQPDDRPRRRWRTVRQDAELGRARRDARSGRLLRQRVVASRNWCCQYSGVPARRTQLLRQEARPHGKHSAERHRDLHSPARTCI